MRKGLIPLPPPQYCDGFNGVMPVILRCMYLTKVRIHATKSMSKHPFAKPHQEILIPQRSAVGSSGILPLQAKSMKP